MKLVFDDFESITPNPMSDKIDKVYVVKFATGDVKTIAYAMAYLDQPSLTLEDESGNKITWAENLCSPATPEQETAYWKSRALQAEARAPGSAIAAWQNAVGMQNIYHRKTPETP